MPKDPVCEMPVEEATEFHSERDGEKFYFCSAACKSKFDAEPAKYISASQKNKATTTSREDGTQISNLPIVGMHCATCATTIEKKSAVSRVWQK